MAAIRSTLEPHTRDIVAPLLQQSLVDLVDLALVGKQAHWTVTGAQFRTLHLQLDEVVEAARRHADTVAERAAALGAPPDGRASTVAHDSRVPQSTADWQRDREVVGHFVDAYAKIIAAMRERIARAEVDLVTQDVLIQIVGEMEKQYWMFQAQQEAEQVPAGTRPSDGE